MHKLSRLLFAIISLGVTEECDDDARTTRRVFMAASLFVGVAAPAWGAMYAAFGEPGPALIPSVYSLITLASFVAFWRYGGWQWFRTSQLLLIFLLPFALMWSLGGYIPGSTVMIWAVLAPIGALWGGRSREAFGWAVAFCAGAVLSGVIDPYLRDSNDLPDALITILFVLNVTFVTSVILLLLDFYVGQKDTLIAVMRRNRELESAYMAQEVTLRQSDKLATLGKLSAGMAHELNNPTAAAQQATQHLASLLVDEAQLSAKLAALDLVDDEQAALDSHLSQISARVQKPEFPDPLERSDHEYAVHEYLEHAGVEDAWEITPSLVNLGIDVGELERLSARLRADRFAPVVAVLAMQYQLESLVTSLDESTDRIIEIVTALKSYSQLDQAPRQLIDVHEGLDSTLVMLQSRLATGIEVRRVYADDLPAIDAFGSELNQVWTNILDNSIDAMGSKGVITITTKLVGERVVVDITDTGPGIPAEIASQVFDPFVTTKDPGDGTGLGLNISHNIITHKHGGEIVLSSEPGRTTFTVSVPVAASAEDDRYATSTEGPLDARPTSKE